MKFAAALKIAAIGLHSHGYMVYFDRKNGNIRTSDHFPEKHAGEELIADPDVAWQIAEAFAAKTVGVCVNITVVDSDFQPISERTIANRG